MTSISFFTRVRPQDNEYRWYAIGRRPTLFGTWAVHLSWGRLGANRYQQRIVEFDAWEAAAAAARAQAERRLKRGYEHVFDAGMGRGPKEVPLCLT